MRRVSEGGTHTPHAKTKYKLILANMTTTVLSRCALKFDETELWIYTQHFSVMSG